MAIALTVIVIPAVAEGMLNPLPLLFSKKRARLLLLPVEPLHAQNLLLVPPLVLAIPLPFVGLNVECQCVS